MTHDLTTHASDPFHVAQHPRRRGPLAKSTATVVSRREPRQRRRRHHQSPATSQQSTVAGGIPWPDGRSREPVKEHVDTTRPGRALNILTPPLPRRRAHYQFTACPFFMIPCDSSGNFLLHIYSRWPAPKLSLQPHIRSRGFGLPVVKFLQAQGIHSKLHFSRMFKGYLYGQGWSYDEKSQW